MKSGQVFTDNRWLVLPDEVVALYNLFDCTTTAALVEPTKALLHQSGNTQFFETEFQPMLPVVLAMQARGIGYLDKPARNSMRHQLRKEIATLEASIIADTKGTYTDKLFNSPKQLATLLFEEWGLPQPKATRKRKSTSTDLHALTWILAHLRKRDEPYRLKLHGLFHRSRLQTILERYLVVEGDPDGRVRPTIKLSGTETGRFAYAGGPGEAVQQWPAECRHLIRAAPGHVFVGRDYSQLEARILATLAQDIPTLEALRSGKDIHTENCRTLFGLSETQYDQLDPYRKAAFRNYAKTFLYGFSYGAKGDSVQMKLFCPCHCCAAKAPAQVNLSVLEIKRAAARWEQEHWAIMDWRAKLVESVYGYGRDRTWTSPFGWRRRFWEPQDEGERSLMNCPMQHSAAMIINRAMVKLFTKYQVPLVLQYHDELVLEVPESEAELWHTRVKDEMEAPIPELGNMSFPTSKATSDNWGGLK